MKNKLIITIIIVILVVIGGASIIINQNNHKVTSFIQINDQELDLSYKTSFNLFPLLKVDNNKLSIILANQKENLHEFVEVIFTKNGLVFSKNPLSSIKLESNSNINQNLNYYPMMDLYLPTINNQEVLEEDNFDLLTKDSFKIEKSSSQYPIYNFIVDDQVKGNFYELNSLKDLLISHQDQILQTDINKGNIQNLPKLKILNEEIDYESILENHLDINIGVFTSNLDILSIYPNKKVLILDYDYANNNYTIRYVGDIKLQNNKLVMTLIDTITNNKYQVIEKDWFTNKYITINGKDYNFSKINWYNLNEETYEFNSTHILK